MSPTAVYKPLEQPAFQTTTSKGLSLVIGSPATAQDGQYQTLVTSLGESRTVEKQMLDRLVDGATTLPPSSYSSIYVTLSEAEYKKLLPGIMDLLSQLMVALAPLGTLHLLPAAPSSLQSELTIAGFVVLSTGSELIAQRPSHAPGATFSLKKKSPTTASALPDSAAAEQRKSTKKALWTLTAASSTSTIDSDLLLTESDRARPVPTCEPLVKGQAPPRRKRACKGCTCGLAEYESEVLKQGAAVVVDGEDGAWDAPAALTEREKLERAAQSSFKATSSCGSCYLGDAFRCASCPYLGLPAFKPGEKVQIDLGMDDI